MNKIWGAEGKDRKPRKEKKERNKAHYQRRYGINFYKRNVIYGILQEMEKSK